MNEWTLAFPSFSEKCCKTTEKKIRKAGSLTFVDGEARSPWGVGSGGFFVDSATQARVNPMICTTNPCGHSCSPFQRPRTLARDCRRSSSAPGPAVPTDLEINCLMYTVCLAFNLKWSLQFENYSDAWLFSAQTSRSINELQKQSFPPSLSQ